jgi:D-mannonate dehydratase
MYISEQLLNPDERRLRLSTQLGVEHVVLDNRGTELVSARGGVSEWDARKLADYRQWVEGFGLELDVFALDVGSILLDSLVDLEGAKKQRATLAANIRKAADAGIGCLKYNVQMVGITRTGLKPGRGGAQNSGFVHAEYSAEDDRKHSYWGVGYPTSQVSPQASNMPTTPPEGARRRRGTKAMPRLRCSAGRSWRARCRRSARRPAGMRSSSWSRAWCLRPTKPACGWPAIRTTRPIRWAA